MLLIFYIFVIRLSFTAAGTGDVPKWQEYVKVSVSKPYNELFPACLNYQCPFPYYDGTYPPGYFLLYYIFSQILPVDILGTFTTVKLIIFFFYMLTLLTLISINFWKDRHAQSFSTIVMSTLVLFGTVISIGVNSLGLGYTDIFIYPFIAASIFLLWRGKLFLSGLLFAAGTLIKWQPLIFLPFLIIYLFKSSRTTPMKLKNVFIFFLGAFIPVVMFLPLNPNQIPVMFYAVTQGAYMDHVFSSALNVQWISTYLLHIIFPALFGPLADGLNSYIVVREAFTGLLQLPKLFFWLAYGLVVLKFMRARVENAFLFRYFLLTAIVGYSTYFMFSSGVHENHLSVAVLLSLILYIIYPQPKTRIFLFFFDMAHLVNMAIFYGFTGSPIISSVGRVDLSIPLTVFSIIGYMLLLRCWDSPKSS